MDDYISKKELLRAIFDLKVAESHSERCSQLLEVILKAPVIDVVPKSDLDTLKSLITHKEDEAYNKGYADAKADLLEKLKAEVERAETIAKYGDDFYEGKAEGVNAAMNCILSEGEE